MDLRPKNLDALLVSLPENISYLTGYPSRDSWLFLSKKARFYLTDSRYTREVKNNLNPCYKIKEIGKDKNNSLYRRLQEFASSFNLKNIGFEAASLTFSQYQKINDTLRKETKLIPTSGLIEGLRQIKDSQEIATLKKAGQIAVNTMKFARSLVIPGKKEIEIAAELERFIRYNGARQAAFDIIVASGPNSSYPHHSTGERRLRDNEPVLIDLGVDYQGYKSDLTRVFFLGKISALARRTYAIIRAAQERAISKIKPGISIAKIDAVSRQYIAKKGYGKFFSHSLGHGIGLAVHEAPRISASQQGILKTGMIFTVEPGIYLPGKFGIRLEDMVLITRKGVEVLTEPSVNNEHVD